MGKNLTLIFALIMLENRLSFETASKLFDVDQETLKNNIATKAPALLDAINYLTCHEIKFIKETPKNIFNAQYNVRTLKRITQVKDKEEKYELLKQFMYTLRGPHFTEDIQQKDRHFTEEQRIKILKYRVKYGLDDEGMYNEFGMSPSNLREIEKAIPEGDLKERVKVLREYVDTKTEHRRFR